MIYKYGKNKNHNYFLLTFKSRLFKTAFTGSENIMHLLSMNTVFLLNAAVFPVNTTELKDKEMNENKENSNKFLID